MVADKNINLNIQKAYDADIQTRLTKVDKKATDAMQSFAALVAELNKLQGETKGTSGESAIKGTVGSLNNDVVAMSRMMEAHLANLHGALHLQDETSAIPFPS